MATVVVPKAAPAKAIRTMIAKSTDRIVAAVARAEVPIEVVHLNVSLLRRSNLTRASIL